MITDETKVLLTIYEKGRLGLKKSNAGTKFQKQAMQKSPFVKETEQGVFYTFDGAKWYKQREGKKIPKYFEGKPYYKAPKYQQVVTKTTMSESCVQFFISDEGRPASISKRIWDKMGAEKRLEANLAINADGKDWEYVLIN